MPQRVEQQLPAGEAVPPAADVAEQQPHLGRDRRSRPRPGCAATSGPSRDPWPLIHSPTGTVKPCFGANGRATGRCFSSHLRRIHLPTPVAQLHARPADGTPPSPRRDRGTACAPPPHAPSGSDPASAADRAAASRSCRSPAPRPAGSGRRPPPQPPPRRCRRARPTAASAAHPPCRSCRAPTSSARPATTAASHCDSGRSRRRSRRRPRRSAPPSRPAARAAPGTRSG